MYIFHYSIYCPFMLWSSCQMKMGMCHIPTTAIRFFKWFLEMVEPKSWARVTKPHCWIRLTQDRSTGHREVRKDKHKMSAKGLISNFAPRFKLWLIARPKIHSTCQVHWIFSLNNRILKIKHEYSKLAVDILIIWEVLQLLSKVKVIILRPGHFYHFTTRECGSTTSMQEKIGSIYSSRFGCSSNLIKSPSKHVQYMEFIYVYIYIYTVL